MFLAWFGGKKKNNIESRPCTNCMFHILLLENTHTHQWHYYEITTLQQLGAVSFSDASSSASLSSHFPHSSDPYPSEKYRTFAGHVERIALEGLQPIKRNSATLWRTAAHKTKRYVCNLAQCLLAGQCSSILATAGGKGAPGSLHHHPAPTYHCIFK